MYFVVVKRYVGYGGEFPRGYRKLRKAKRIFFVVYLTAHEILLFEMTKF